MENRLSIQLLALIALLFLSLNSDSAFAKNYPIGQVQGLYDACQNIVLANEKKEYDKTGYGLCFGYFRGIKDSYDFPKMTGRGSGNICFPNKTTWMQYIKVFMKWTDQNPSKLTSFSWVIVIRSLKEAYPCMGR